MAEQITPQTQTGATFDVSAMLSNLMPMVSTIMNMMMMFKMLKLLLELLKGVF